MSDQPENPESEPSIFSVSVEPDGTLKLTRRDFLKMALVVGSALTIAGCQAAQTQEASPTMPPSQISAPPLPPIPLLAQPEAGAAVVETLHANDVVTLISDRRDLGWVQVTSPGGKVGWVSRTQVDFTRAFTAESGANTMPTQPAGTPAPGTIYLVLTAAGAPTSARPVTCAQYGVVTPIALGAGTATPTLPPNLLVGPITVDQNSGRVPNPINPCSCVGNQPPTCPAHNLCSCVSFTSCSCLTYFKPPCSCQAYFPCSCLAYIPCSCLAYFPCACLANFPCSFT